MRPAEVLDHQASLSDFLASQDYGAYMNNFMNDVVRKGSMEMRGDMQGSDLCRIIRKVLSAAYSYHVQADMTPMIRAASVDLEETDYLTHDLLPTEQGFVVFDDGLVTKDMWGTQMATGAIAWSHGSVPMGVNDMEILVPGIWIYDFTDFNDPRDMVNADLKTEASTGYGTLLKLGRWQVNHVWFMPYEQRVGPIEIMPREDYVKFAVEGQTPQSSPNPARTMVAFFRLLGQTIVTVKDAPIERAARRRAERAKMPARVQTITLRKRETHYLEKGEHQTVDWSHRWLVRGTWQWRKCGESHPLAESYEKGYRARLYIAPYVKGPEGKPLIITEKVFDLAR